VAGYELLGLGFYSRYNFWVAVTQRGNAVAACAVHVFSAVDIPQKSAFALRDDDWFFGENVG
jgi:hypothetical protein